MDSSRGILHYLKQLLHIGRKAHGAWEKAIDHTEVISNKIGGLSENIVEGIRDKTGQVRDRVDDSIDPVLEKLKKGGGKAGRSFFARMGSILRGSKSNTKPPSGKI